MAGEDRTRGALLAGLAAVAVALGAWWWQGSAPALGRTDVAPGPSTDAFLEPGVRLVDPRTGQVLPVPEAEPDEFMVVPEEADDTQETVVYSSIWLAQSHLAPGDDPLVRQADPSPGERLLLTVSCTGGGTLMVAFMGAEEDTTLLRTTCPAEPINQPLTAYGGPLRVRFTVADGEVDLDALLAVRL
ncbi:hypothetical protein [Micromonospora sp. NPDC093277]|uniref:hypothetical protein n=1 Tax=Micromonospora sp. NPDC093277 TaxID=3364291 RepID=UPI00382A12E8